MVVLDHNVIIEPNPATLSLSMDPRFARQRLEVRRVDLLEQLTPRFAVLAQDPCVVEIGDALGDRSVHVGQAVEDPVKSGPEPSVRQCRRRLDFRLIPRLSRPRREHRRAVVAAMSV